MADAGQHSFFGGKPCLPQSPQKIAIAIPTYGKMHIAFHLYKTNK